jgi:hypothetical protein
MQLKTDFETFFRNGQGNVKCTTYDGSFSSAAANIGYGGNAGYGALGCPPGDNIKRINFMPLSKPVFLNRCAAAH